MTGWRQKCSLPAIVSAAVVGLQLLNIPGLSDVHGLGKLFFVAFCVLIAVVVVALRRRTFTISPVSGLFWLVFVGFACGVPLAKNSTWALYYLAILGIYLLLLVLFVDFAANRAGVERSLVDAILVGGVVVAALGLFEYVMYYLTGPSNAMLIPYLLPRDEWSRVAGPYGQSNLMAVFLSVVLLVFFRKYLHLSGDDTAARPWAVLGRYLPFGLVALVFMQTGSRAGLLSFTLILGVLLYRVASGGYLSDAPHAKRVFYVLVGIYFAALLSHHLLDPLIARQGLSLQTSRIAEAGVATDGRILFWTSAILIFLDHPWWGVGLDGYRFLQNDYGPRAHDLLGFVQYEAMGNTNWAHNEYLQILCEGGLLAFFPLVVLLIIYLVKFKSNILTRKQIADPDYFYAHLYILPFLLQSMFEWPLRHPGLLLLFVVFCALLLRHYPLREMNLNKVSRGCAVAVAAVALFFLGELVVQDVEYRRYLQNVSRTSEKFSTFAEFEAKTQSSFTEYRVLADGLHYYVKEALAAKDSAQALQVIPHLERLCRLEGVNVYWFNLALLYYKAGYEIKAREAIKVAIERMPMNETFWSFLHYLHAREISRKTGKPVEEYLPKPGSVDLSALKGLLQK